ncbi:ABC-type multidrug transport system ATPase subunit [Duganella sp. 1411]|uniref:ABC transporter ATP-binding protein n=1 Tax=Duganella sp. 1411 TaxID=2806572 RepID=UPI001AE2974B|nr:ABC transporter ATP-binding protein [Duganella sp. 1411]MBP1203518.1 ABC-type multidrug transport system ATPase subunit [Duganella sp. 1411]
MIQVSGLSKSLGAQTVFRSLAFEWGPRGAICICGPNGSGKTTLLSMLAGASAPSAGDIVLNGRSLVHAHQAALEVVSYVPDGCPVYPFLSGREWLDFVKSIRPCDLGRERELLERFNIAHLLDMRIDSMSLGTARKFMLTAGLICEAAILILDEPTNGLDLASFDVLRDALARHRQQGLVVLSYHDPAQQRQLDVTAVQLHALEA